MKFSNSRGLVLMVLSIGVVAGCSGRQIYQSAAGWRQNECQKILEDGERARCMQQANKDFDTYSRERKFSAEER
ncbi:MAG: hypothetical protein ABI728_05450 [Betaproteobacteria bacterium]